VCAALIVTCLTVLALSHVIELPRLPFLLLDCCRRRRRRGRRKRA